MRLLKRYILNRLRSQTHKYLLSIIITALSTHAEIQSIVILIHGTFAREALWCKPGGDFYHELETQCLARGHRLVPFTWSGKFSTAAREEAAALLASLIAHYVGKEEIVLIGHSHGANVIFRASTKLREKIPTLEKKYLIDRMYLLAPPIDLQEYYPCMNTVEHCYLLFSHGDYIQKALFLYQRTLPAHDRISNFEVLFIEESKHIHPSHTQMHDTRIARWILALPHELSALKAYGFESYNPGNDGQLSFYQGQVSFKSHTLPS